MLLPPLLLLLSVVAAVPPAGQATNDSEAAPAKPEAKLEVNLRLPYETYAAWQPLVLFIKVRNVGESFIEYLPEDEKCWDEANICELFYRKKGEEEFRGTVDWCIWNAAYGYMALLAPGEELSVAMDVAPSLKNGAVALDAGEYELKVTFRGQNDVTAESNVVSLKVLPPSEDAKEAFAIWRTFCQDDIVLFPHPPTEEIETLKTKFRGTVYGQYLLYVKVRRVAQYPFMYTLTSEAREAADYLLGLPDFPLRCVVAFDKLRLEPEPRPREQQLKDMEEYLREYPDSPYAPRVAKAIAFCRKHEHVEPIHMIDAWMEEWEAHQYVPAPSKEEAE